MTSRVVRISAKAWGQKLAIAVVIAASSHAGCRSVERLPVQPTAAETIPGLGRAQGISVVDEKVYLYGDAAPGIIREFEISSSAATPLVATGRDIRLTVGGQNLLNHPTGLAVHSGMPSFIGNTVSSTREGKIYHIDFPCALHDG